ncbi:MAG TPA: amidohydrolase [Bacteroidia bacterium]|nr:amidohydrolase [Bacteroidia bacterium]
MAIKDGKILFCASNDEVLNKYQTANLMDAHGKFIFPGFIDAHCHFYGYGKGLNELDLVNTASFQEVINALIYYAKENNIYPEHAEINVNKTQWIIGRGWDQNDWKVNEYPDKRKLDSLFPNIPVLLKRIDGHAILVNQKALDIAGFTEKTKINGGELVLKNGKLSGILIDNAGDSLEYFIPKQNKDQIQKALLKAQDSCLKFGLTTVDDAGLSKIVIEVIDALQREGQMKMRVYAMLTPNKENLDHYLKNGIYKTDKLNVRSFKFYADGALGSRGACLKKEYKDKKNWKGFLLSDIPYFEKNAALLSKTDFQMNTHCIGDSSSKVILDAYSRFGKGKRWRVEHAQVISEEDFSKFEKDIIPSVQPTHATSDMYWAKDRLGEERVRGAYAYKKLLNAAGIIALGTDFPVESISPFKTFYAAVFRKDEKNFPEGGYQKENALSREETLKGMTIWAAFANFEEKEKGSLEASKYADLIILDKDLMKCSETEILKTKVISTFIHGEEVYSAKDALEVAHP